MTTVGEMIGIICPFDDSFRNKYSFGTATFVTSAVVHAERPPCDVFEAHTRSVDFVVMKHYEVKHE